MLRKGFIFTLDAILALLIVVTFMGIISFGWSEDISNYNLRQYAQDSLTILEKDHSLHEAVKTGSSGILEAYMGSMPENMCASMIIEDDQGLMVMNSTEICIKSDDVVKSRRVFIYEGEPYSAGMEVWYT